MENLAQEKYIAMMLEVDDAGGEAESSECGFSPYLQCKGVMRVPSIVYDRWKEKYWVYNTERIHVTAMGELTTFTVPAIALESDPKSHIEVDVTIVTQPYPMTIMNILDFMH